MFNPYFILVVLALLLTVAHIVKPQVPLWIAVLLITVALLIGAKA